MDNNNNVNISNSTVGSNNEIGNMTVRDNISINYIKLTTELDNFEIESKNLIDDDSIYQFDKQIKDLKIK